MPCRFVCQGVHLYVAAPSILWILAYPCQVAIWERVRTALQTDASSILKSHGDALSGYHFVRVQEVAVFVALQVQSVLRNR